jgi:hypothetical protein
VDRGARRPAAKEARRPRQIDRHIPADLDTICCKAMAKQARQRYRDAGEMAEDLRRYLNGHVIRARRPGVAGSSIKFVRRIRPWPWGRS